MVTKEDIIYAAGFFDGEGSVQIHKNILQKRGKTRTYTLRVAVTNTNEDVINWFLVTFKGSKLVHNKGIQPNHKKCWRWVTHSQGAEDFLKAIYPYLKVKRLQAEVGFQIREITKRSRKNNFPSVGEQKMKQTSPEVIAKQNELKNRLHILNGRKVMNIET